MCFKRDLKDERDFASLIASRGTGAVPFSPESGLWNNKMGVACGSEAVLRFRVKRSAV